ncbi:predicted protein [Botrytis cinerea T4]|uniref:Uncharacterized protein n=1 Tax=Botryotinia fuckeliana (strain T4) TaxID=999810 RepID=G2XYX7_BOTF4|nr:predicted protein [Botrytis cinerea T4]
MHSSYQWLNGTTMQEFTFAWSFSALCSCNHVNLGIGNGLTYEIETNQTIITICAVLTSASKRCPTIASSLLHQEAGLALSLFDNGFVASKTSDFMSFHQLQSLSDEQPRDFIFGWYNYLAMFMSQ